MSTFYFDKFYESLSDLKSAEAVDKAFEAVLALPADEQKAVGRALERKFLSGMGSLKDCTRRGGPRATKKAVKKWCVYTDSKTGKLMPAAAAVPFLQAANQVNSYVDKLLGNEASPVMKAYNDAAAKLTALERNSTDAIIKPSLAVVDAIAKEEGIRKVNPARFIKRAASAIRR